jgi:hypothetical protein
MEKYLNYVSHVNAYMVENIAIIHWLFYVEFS